VTYNAEHIYSFDLFGSDQPEECKLIKQGRSVDRKIASLKEKARECLVGKQLGSAIALYSQCLQMIPAQREGNNSQRAILLNNRAYCLMIRNWLGDDRLALLDCEAAVRLDHGYFKAHKRHLEALFKLNRHEDVSNFAVRYVKRFPEHAEDLYKYLPKGVNGEFQEEECSEEIEVEITRPGFFMRFCGSSNIQTDIKEACFLPGDRSIAAGSDDGFVYIWDSLNGKLLNVLYGGDDVVNCVQPHPFYPLLVTSGIESVIRVFDCSKPSSMKTMEATFASHLKHNADSLKAHWNEIPNRMSSGSLNMALLNLLMRSQYSEASN